MTLIRIYKINKKSKNNKNITKEIVQVTCDDCGLIFDHKFNSRAKKSELHFCCKKCSNNSITNGRLRKSTDDGQFEKYGSIYVNSKEFKKKQEENCIINYGVKTIMASPLIQEKIRKTCKEKYGRETYTGTEDHKSKCDYKDIAQKAWNTKIKNGTCSKSKPEEKLFDIIKKNFGVDDIFRQISVIKQFVDFYIKSKDLYIQVDGVYWHGLNRKTKDIKLGKTRQDLKIYKQILRDRKLNKYMKNNNKKLIRITDEHIKKLSDADILKLLEKN